MTTSSETRGLSSRTHRRKRLRRLLIAIIVIVVVVFAATHTFLSNAVTSALRRSLGTITLQSATFPAINLSSPTPFVEINITITLTNPSDYPITIDVIDLTFSVDQRIIGGLNIPLGENVPAGESTIFFFIQRVDDNNILQSIMNPTFILSGEGLAKGSVHFLYFQTSSTRTLSFSQTVLGVLEAKS
ncbi:MAG: LEA type 2 family protein [Candidatus Bathyarchaeota archaeon]|nr:MAG: LEA type 2 family protein [Candidatus Bathyarchaeota archaeon]